MIYSKERQIINSIYKMCFYGLFKIIKRYKCYSQSLKKYITSTNVAFFEKSLFFCSSKESTSIIKVLPILVINQVLFSSRPSTPQQDRPLITYQRHPHLIKPQTIKDALVNSQTKTNLLPPISNPLHSPSIALNKGI